VNIDIAHWNLAGVHPSQVVEHEPVFSAIVHAHISGSHRCAHFGDIAPLCLNQESDFDDWLTVIRRRAQRAGRPSFSGVIAIELEATKGPDFLRAAVKDTYDLLARRELPV
jgi:hypothetical protein